jgi:soluble lytic murein transglycosylase-like protein
MLRLRSVQEAVPAAFAALFCLMTTSAMAEAETPMAADGSASAVSANCSEAKNPGSREDYLEYAACEAKQSGLPAEVAHAVIEIESNFHPFARGGDGEVGLMQVLPSTAHMMGFRGTLDELAEPRTNIRYGVRYLSQAWRLGGQDLCTAVMKYRAGHNETRFSHLSVHYCQRARSILKRQGYEVTGLVPVATFGLTVAASGGSGRGTCLRRSFVPGPGYGRCISAGGKISSAKAVALRRSIFGG